jgi:hypothetical protein
MSAMAGKSKAKIVNNTLIFICLAAIVFSLLIIRALQILGVPDILAAGLTSKALKLRSPED